MLEALHEKYNVQFVPIYIKFMKICEICQVIFIDGFCWLYLMFLECEGLLIIPSENFVHIFPGQILFAKGLNKRFVLSVHNTREILNIILKCSVVPVSQYCIP